MSFSNFLPFLHKQISQMPQNRQNVYNLELMHII